MLQEWCRSRSIEKIGVGQSEGEEELTRRTVNSMSMLGESTVRNQGINTSETRASAAWHTPESSYLKPKEGNKQGLEDQVGGEETHDYRTVTVQLSSAECVEIVEVSIDR